MDIVKCGECGKHFDIETYPVCPNCGGRTSKTINEEPSGFNLFRRKKTKKEEPLSDIRKTKPIDRPLPKKPEYDEPINTLSDEQKKAKTEIVKGNTVSLWGKTEPGPITDYPDEPPVEISGGQYGNTVDENNIGEADYDYGDDTYDEAAYDEISYDEQPQNIPKPADKPSAAPVEQKPVESRSLSEEIGNLSASSGGKTVSFFDATMSRKNRENKAAPVPDAEPVDQSARQYTDYGMPVAGWLVCVAGNHLGQSFTVQMGKNSIGRGEGNNICLTKDETVSRDTQADIVYEPKKRNFFVVPRSDGSNLVYVNDDYVEGRSLLHDRDILEIGSSRLMFVRLCGDDFAWEDII